MATRLLLPDPVAGVIDLATVSANPQSGTAYTLVKADNGRVVEMTSGSACTVTIPTDTAVPFPVGSVLEVMQYGAGQVTVAAASGVTIRNAGATNKSRAQYATMTLRKRTASEWVLSGDTAAS